MSKVKTGIDNIDKYIDIFKGKRVGLITNPTGINSEFKSTIDILNEKTNLTALYSPEHGIRGDVQAGELFGNYTDERTGITVYSLYGDNKKPSYEILKDIDVLAFDMQDAGSRFYTYLYSMAYAMQSCKKFNIDFVIFDRPNPIGGEEVEGNILEKECSSFVGLYPIAVRYGLTIGEVAKLFNEEFNIGCNLKVIPLTGWERSMYYDETGLPFVAPSPNMPTLDTMIVYPGTTFFEGTNISEGRGTTKPFEVVGAPWLDPYSLSDKLNSLKLPGVYFRPTYFTPTFSKHEGNLCKGVQLHVFDRHKFKPVETGLMLLNTIKEESHGEFQFIEAFTEKLRPLIDYLLGTSIIREGNYDINEVNKKWHEDALKFKATKEKYHIY